jgi:hypothetical protein
VTDRLELGFFGAPVVVQRGTVDVTDHGDFTLAAKYRFHDAAEGSALPSLGVLPFVKLPASEEPLGSGKTDAGAVLLASLDLPAQLSLDLNASLAAIGQSHPSGYLLQAVLAAGLSHDVDDWLTLFTDVMYASREERDSRDGVLRRGRDLAPGPQCRPRRLGRDLARRSGPRLAGPGWPEPAIRPLMAGRAL